MTAPEPMPLLVAHGVSKSFVAVEALVDVAREAGASPSRSPALVGRPRLLILDEPTAALGVVQTGQVLELIHHLREQGLAIVGARRPSVAKQAA